jgi:hypothetical protein
MKSILLLLMIVLASVNANPKYVRSSWGSGWKDFDKDCQDTRQEVLIAESLIEVTLDERGCKVLAGRWLCPFTGKVITNPKVLDIDHMVPLKEAHDSGGWEWSKEVKVKYYNDLTSMIHLVAVYRSVNRSKGSKSPDEWMPPNKEYHCAYLLDWVEIKHKAGLTMTTVEKEYITETIPKVCKD